MYGLSPHVIEDIDRVGRTFYSKENFCGEPIRR